MTNTLTSTLFSMFTVGFATFGAIFSTAFIDSPTVQAQVLKAIALPSNYATIAKAPVSKSLKINQTHIFQGEINRQGAAVGFHHRSNGKNSINGRMVRITGLPNSQGVYVGRVEIRNPVTGQWISKVSSSSFFPDRWSQSQVLSEIQGAFAKVNPPTERWQSTSPSGLRIEGYYNKTTNTINTAYPIYRR